MTTNDLPIIAFFKYILDPTLIWSLLLISLWIYGEPFTSQYLVLIIIVFFISGYVYEQTSLYQNWRRDILSAHIRDTLIGWIIIIAILYFLGHVTQFHYYFSTEVILLWVMITPIALIISHLAVRGITSIQRSKGQIRYSAIIGANNASSKILDHISKQPLLFIENLGYFDDRATQRFDHNFGPQLGKTEDIIHYIKHNKVDIIFISLPMSSQPRILRILEELSDTTASILFLPDTNIFDLLQARIDYIGDIPVVSYSQSPHTGINGVIKIASDYIFAALILVLLSPLLLCIALAVKLTSPGPIIFKQHRYGLNGEEIIIYKFRSMTVTEDDKHVIQAKKNDQRFTPIGAFLRRTSLDELPQFINVLQGRMSIVGPRPHAVAHNEAYRKLIRGYMMRHKAKPGITGWAQVNGWRGETETIEKMKARIDHDLHYLNNWSLSLDIWIILRTVWVVLRRDNAH